MKIAALACLALLAAAPAGAQMVKGQDPDSLVKAMQAAGYLARLEQDKVGDPMITSGASGTTFQILFYGCKEHKDCTTVQFYSAYNFDKALPLEQINEWNRKNRFGRAYLDNESDPILEMDVDLDDGGMSSQLFIDNLEFWTTVLGNFERHIGYRK